MTVRDLPGGPGVKNLPCKAGGAGSIPRWGTKIPSAAAQLSPCAVTRECVHCKERFCMRQLRLKAAYMNK